MREVIPLRLWQGNAIDARDIRGVLDLGINALVDLALEEVPPKMTRDLVYCRFPLMGGGGNSPATLRAAIDTTVDLLQKDYATFVYCSAGMSRSPCVVAATLAILENRDPSEVLAEVVAGHPHDVSPVLWNDIVNCCFP